MAGFDTTVILDEAAIADLAHQEWCRTELLRKGSAIAAVARGTAPRETGAGAGSISATAESGPDGWEVHISWDQAHQYMAAQHSGALQAATAASAVAQG